MIYNLFMSEKISYIDNVCWCNGDMATYFKNIIVENENKPYFIRLVLN